MDDTYNIRLSRRCYYVCLVICIIGFSIYFVLELMGIPFSKVNPYPCSMLTAYGLYCPGCGGTRAMAALMRGDFVSSFLYHPAVPYTAVVLACYMISHTLNIFTKGKVKAMLFRPIYGYLLIAIIIVQWIVKVAIIFASGAYVLG